MSRVIFDQQPVVPPMSSGRADVTCFVGLARLVPGAAVSASVAAWLGYLGYSSGPSPLPNQIATLTNIPIPITTYAGFTAVFDDGSSGQGFGTDYMAATVRCFFAQGGKKCYIVRVGDPVKDSDMAADKTAKLNAILGSIVAAQNGLASLTGDGPSNWMGAAALGAIEEVSTLVLPDLPAVCASEPVGAAGQVPFVELGPQEFTVCTPGPVTPRQQVTYQGQAPRLASADYTTWANAVLMVLNYLATGVNRHQLHLREIQFVAAFPLPQDLDVATAAENPSSAEIAQDMHDIINTWLPDTALPGNSNTLSSPFLQLCYPWLKTSGSVLLLEQLEPPDGALAGLIARNALLRGTFTSATKIIPAEIYDVSPMLPTQETKSSATALTWGTLAAGTPAKALIERLSLFGFAPGGMRLLSDVTAYPGEMYRSGPVNRLTAVIFRAARTMGESAVFQSNGPALWGKVQRFLQNMLTRLWTLNALDGATVADAFSVRCDQSTMTQNDRDNGKIIALVSYTPAATIETIHVQLAMEAGSTSAQEIATNAAAGFGALGNVSASTMAGVN